MQEIWNAETGRIENMSDEEFEKYISAKFAPIDPIWDKAKTWVGLTSEPVITKLILTHDQRSNSSFSGTSSEHYYVVTKSRVFTHRLFTALVGNYCWMVRPTPEMKRKLFEDAKRYHLLGRVFEKPAENVSKESHIMGWWSQMEREFIFNCKEWIDQYNFDTENHKILEWLDTSNVKFTEKAGTIRTDSYRNGIFSEHPLLAKIRARVEKEDIPF